MTKDEVLRTDVNHLTLAQLRESQRLLNPHRNRPQAQARLRDLEREIRRRK